jgi:hypothetical protein
MVVDRLSWFVPRFVWGRLALRLSQTVALVFDSAPRASCVAETLTGRRPGSCPRRRPPPLVTDVKVQDISLVSWILPLVTSPTLGKIRALRAHASVPDCGGGLTCSKLSATMRWDGAACSRIFAEVRLTLRVRASARSSEMGCDSPLGERRSPHENLDSLICLAAAIFTTWP